MEELTLVYICTVAKDSHARARACVCVCVCVCKRSYDTGDTGRSFDPIFMKFACLVRVHSWVNPIVFGHNRPNRTTYMGENVLQNQFFGFNSDGMGFFEKKT